MLGDNSCLTKKRERKEFACTAVKEGLLALLLQRRRQYVKNLQQQLSLNKLILPDYEMNLDNSIKQTEKTHRKGS